MGLRVPGPAREPGRDLRLTIDGQMQLQAESVLARVGAKFKPKGSTAIVMDPQNGEVLALANWPKLDANDPTSATPEAQQNRALGFTYEPGSTFKAVTVAGALQDGKVTPETIFGLPPTLQVADRVDLRDGARCVAHGRALRLPGRAHRDPARSR